jgi:hypothetical protein
MTDMGIKMSYKEVMDGRTERCVCQLLDVFV